MAIENSENEKPNDQKSTKSLSENSAHGSLSMAKKVIETEAGLSVQSIGKTFQQSESTIPLENDQSVLNRAFDMESDYQENVQEMTRMTGSNTESNPKIPISIIDYNESEVADQEDIPAIDKTFSPNPKPASSQIPLKLKRLRFKTPPKKAISMAKKVKITEVAEHLAKEINQTNALNLPITKTGRSEQVKQIPFRFGLAPNDRGFNFNLNITKIPTLNLKELEQKNKENAETSVTKPKVKLMPNFNPIHERIFEKDMPIDEIENHKRKRAKLITSGVKSSTNENIFKPISQPKSKRKLEINIVQPKIEQSKPLSNVNTRAILNPEQREERRKMMFKQGQMGYPSKKIAEKFIIKGVRTNRRFDLMMEHRSKEKNDIIES